MMIATFPATSPTTASPLTTPPRRYFSANAAPTGRFSTAARRRRNSSARLMPPASGETTATSVSRSSGAKCSTNSGFASRCSVRQRNAFWNAARLCTSSVTTQSVPTASNKPATYRVVTGSRDVVLRSLRAYAR